MTVESWNVADSETDSLGLCLIFCFCLYNFLKFIFKLYALFVGVCIHGCSATEFRGDLEPPELELQEVVSHSKWTLGTTLQVSTTAEHTPDSCTTSPAHLDSWKPSSIMF